MDTRIVNQLPMMKKWWSVAEPQQYLIMPLRIIKTKERSILDELPRKLIEHLSARMMAVESSLARRVVRIYILR